MYTVPNGIQNLHSTQPIIMSVRLRRLYWLFCVSRFVYRDLDEDRAVTISNIGEADLGNRQDIIFPGHRFIGVKVLVISSNTHRPESCRLFRSPPPGTILDQIRREHLVLSQIICQSSWLCKPERPLQCLFQVGGFCIKTCNFKIAKRVTPAVFVNVCNGIRQFVEEKQGL